MEIAQLYTKISALPSELKSEVNDFVDFLLAKRKKQWKKRNLYLDAQKEKLLCHLILISLLKTSKNTCNEPPYR